MKKKITLFLFLISSWAFGQEINEEYDKITFSVIPLVSHIENLQISDTAAFNWAEVPNESILSATRASNQIHSDYLISNKYYYNHSNSHPDSLFFYDSLRTDLLLSNFSFKEFELKLNNKADSSENRVKVGGDKFLYYSNDLYGKWIQTQLENSTVPGEMMYQWTVPEILRTRALGNLAPTSDSLTTDTDNFQFFKRLLEKNYLIVTHTIHTKKYDYTKSKSKMKEATEGLKKKTGDSKFLNKIKSLASTDSKEEKTNASEPLDKDIDVSKYKMDESVYLRAYVFKVKLDGLVMGSLGKFPAEIPQKSNLEFVAKLTFERPLRPVKTKALVEEYGNGQDYVKNVENKFYEKTKSMAGIFLNSGEIPCAIEHYRYLLTLKPENKVELDSLLAICQQKLKASPIINQFRLKYEDAMGIDRENLTSSDSLYFQYNQACSLTRYKEVGPSEKSDSQGSFNEVLTVLEREVNEFKLLAEVKGIKGNKVEGNLNLSHGIFLDQQFKVVQRTMNFKTRELYDRTIGGLKVIEVSENGESVFAQVSGGNVKPGMLIVEDNNKGFSVNVGYGFRYDMNAISVGVENLLGYLIKAKMPFPGMKVGLNYVVNLGTRFSSNTYEKYIPSYIDLNFSRELYLTKIIDVKPYVAIGYGGEWFVDEDKNENVKGEKKVFATIGFGLPINLPGRNSKLKIKLMPDFSYSIGFNKPQYGLLTKIDF